MKKKGIVSTVVIFWALGILVVFFVIWLVPDLLGKARDVAFAFGLGQLPEERPGEFIGESKVPTEITDYFDYLFEELGKFPGLYGDKNHCLITINRFEEKKGYNIVLSSERIKIMKSGQGRLASAATEFDEPIPDFKPCIVYGDSAGVFVNNVIRGGSASPGDRYNKDPGTTTLILISDDELETNGLKHKVLKKRDPSVYIYKPDDDHFCFISTHGGGDCNADGGTVEEGCRNEIPSFEKGLVMCEDLNQETPQSGKAPALIVKIDTEGDNTQVWDFRLTSNKNVDVGENIFRLDDFDNDANPGQECVVLAVEEDSGGNNDNAQVWYVKPGSLIEKRDVGRLWDGLIPLGMDGIIPTQISAEGHPGLNRCDTPSPLSGCVNEDFCVNRCRSQFKASLYPKDSEFITQVDGKDRTTIGGEWYTIFSKDGDKDKCGDRCPLLEDDPSSGRKHFKPKYEILCDSDGNWNVCNSNLGHVNGKEITAGGATYKCGNNKWETSSNKVVGARILHVKIDPGDNPTEKWAFHLTEDKNHPMDDVDISQREFRDEMSGKKVCNVYSVNEEGGGKDHLSTWYIAPGGRIKTFPIGRMLFDGIRDKILGVQQDSGKKKGSPYETGPDGHSEAVGFAQYSISTDNDNCGDKGHPCNLLTYEPNDRSYMFVPENELLCDSNGFWRVCESYVNGAEITADGVTYTCREGDTRWKWQS